MKLTMIAGLAVSIAAFGGSAAMAQSQQDDYGQAYGQPYQGGPYDNGQHPQVNPYDNGGAYQDYQNAQSAYDQQRDAAAQDRSEYDARANDYQANRMAYQRQLRAYERARRRYDLEYGPGAYEAYYPAPLPPAPY
jgi:hypothetical protein